MNRRPRILCFGEILWDFLPDGLFAGGAPFNVCYHLHRNDCEAHLVSAVGDDLLGEELLRRIEAWGLSKTSVAKASTRPTGYVRASLGSSGDATYEIIGDVAWDAIPIDEQTRHLAETADAVVFGSLAQRGEENREALTRLLEALPATALRIFDVNLRAPYDDLDRARSLGRRASVIKLNNVEAARLANDDSHPTHREEAHARAIASEAGCGTVCVTAGERGAGLLRDDAWHWEDGRHVEVADTVGAGDSFLAFLVAGLLKGGSSDGELLRRACRLGEWVATQRGATPPYGPSTPT